MTNFRFTLQPYKGISSRYACPQCGKLKSFVRYIDTENKIHFPDYVGRCNREDNCGYHHSPKQYFAEHPQQDQGIASFVETVKNDMKPMSFIDPIYVTQSLSKYEQNNLYLFLSKLFDVRTALDLMRRYKVGTANHWPGSTVFWQIDNQGKTRTGKVMLYNPDTGRRVKQPHPHITWVHSLLKYDDFNLKQCFFGMHLLSDKSKPVAIVESEKTALIASVYMSEYIWIASGGKNGCLVAESNILRGRKIVLFPDLNAFDDWKEKARKLMRLNIQLEMFSYLEEHATDEQRRNGYDIADFLIQSKPKESILDSMVKRNPNLTLLIEKFNLVEV
jgi:hypothetical protein